MARSPESTAREAIRARSSRSFRGRERDGDGGPLAGHPAMFALAPAIELGPIPEGGGYPLGFLEVVYPLLLIDPIYAPAFGPADVVHLCSGSVLAPLTFDLRSGSGARCLADARRLPIATGSVPAVMVDPPYGPEYAEELWGLGKAYPTPAVLLRECARILAPWGRVAFLHHFMPSLPDDLERVHTYGVTTGPGYRIRCLTIARRRPADVGLFS